MNRIIEGAITSPFGLRHDPINGLWRDHNGIDVRAVAGTPIYAPSDCVVRGVYSHAAGGKTLILGSADGAIRYGFCHLSSYCVAFGDRVRKGQMVARSGNSGRTTGPHLHLTVKSGGRWVEARIAEDGTLIEAQYQGGAFVDPTPFLDF